MNIYEEKQFYIDYLKKDILPFWMNNAIDEQYGGVYTCFSNDCTRLISKDKYIWSQGRFAYVLCELASLDIFNDNEKSRFISNAKRTCDFIIENSLMKDNTCAFLVDQSGAKKFTKGCDSYSISFYCDCFVVLGLSALSRILKDVKYAEIALSIMDTILDTKKNGNLKTMPYPIPKGYSAHGTNMILLNSCYELSKSLKCNNHSAHKRINEEAEKLMNNTFDYFVKDNLVREFILDTGIIDNENMIGRYINPGHTLEDMWFLIEQADLTNNIKRIQEALEIIKTTFTIGWDGEYDGLFLFTDNHGGRPSGITALHKKEVMIDKLINDWDSKLWWVHSETLYTLLLAYYKGGDVSFLEMYEKAKDYAFTTFPNPDKSVGEWIAIRTRDGTPSEKNVALPVKDPFHLIRNLLKIIQLTESLCGNENDLKQS